jgi:hypothetical protein
LSDPKNRDFFIPRRAKLISEFIHFDYFEGYLEYGSEIPSRITHAFIALLAVPLYEHLAVSLTDPLESLEKRMYPVR